MDGRCETCRWWIPDAEADIAGDSDDGSDMDPWGRCTRVDLKPGRTTQAVAVGHGGDEAFLDTAHDFGCVQWERKDE